MLDFPKQCTEQDRKVAAAIEHKRRIEEARKARIFNPRIRKIGVGVLIISEHLYNLLNFTLCLNRHCSFDNRF